MVEVTIFVEGGVAPSLADPLLTPDNTILLREAFHALFSQKIPPQEFNLIVVPIGGYLNISNLFLPKASKNVNTVVLIDFAEPANNLQRAIRTGVSKYSTLSFDQNNPNNFRDECIVELGLDGYQERVFFMDKEMEAWILSQPEKVEMFGQKEGFIRKMAGNSIASHASLKVSSPSLINDPKTTLDTIFKQFFDHEKRMKDGKIKTKARGYIGPSDGPKLISMLNLEVLMVTFPDAKKLVEWIVDDIYFLTIFEHPILTRKQL